MKRLLVGLGNPGSEYAKTRHNAGFMCIDALVKELGAGESSAKFKGKLWEVKNSEIDALLFAPTTFMNSSGIAVREICDFYNLEPEQVAIVADDVYIKPGSVRIRKEGADGGHNGWKSIGQHLPFSTYWRVRIGAGVYHQDPEHRGHQPALEEYVLQKFPASDLQQVLHLIDNLVPNLVTWLKTGELTQETRHHQINS